MAGRRCATTGCYYVAMTGSSICVGCKLDQSPDQEPVAVGPAAQHQAHYYRRVAAGCSTQCASHQHGNCVRGCRCRCACHDVLGVAG
jgi:hypothetical protein